QCSLQSMAIFHEEQHKREGASAGFYDCAGFRQYAKQPLEWRRRIFNEQCLAGVEAEFLGYRLCHCRMLWDTRHLSMLRYLLERRSEGVCEDMFLVVCLR